MNYIIKSYKFMQTKSDHSLRNSHRQRKSIIIVLVFLLISLGNLFFPINVMSDPIDFEKDDDDLINKYILSQNPIHIVFDSSNIKRFWIDSSVSCINDSIRIHQQNNKYESNPLKIMLANVDESLDCKVEIISKQKDISFKVFNKHQKLISTSQINNFLEHNIYTSTFHLEDTFDFSFYLVFDFGKMIEPVEFNKMVLSFSKNTDSTYCVSPGSLALSLRNSKIVAKETKDISNNSFSMAGESMSLSSLKKIPVKDNAITTSVKIKNIGDTSTFIYLGYAVYNQEQIKIDSRCYPYKNDSPPLNVISISEDKESIIVDSYPEWDKGCFLALNASTDFSDIPSTSFIGGSIFDIQKLDDGYTKICFKTKLDSSIKTGTKVRVHGKGGNNIYFKSFVLEPNQESNLSYTMKKDESFRQFASKAFSKGVYYVIPLLLSRSVNPYEINSIEVSDFLVSF